MVDMEFEEFSWKALENIEISSNKYLAPKLSYYEKPIVSNIRSYLVDYDIDNGGGEPFFFEYPFRYSSIIRWLKFLLWKGKFYIHNENDEKIFIPSMLHFWDKPQNRREKFGGMDIFMGNLINVYSRFKTTSYSKNYLLFSEFLYYSPTTKEEIEIFINNKFNQLES